MTTPTLTSSVAYLHTFFDGPYAHLMLELREPVITIRGEQHKLDGSFILTSQAGGTNSEGPGYLYAFDFGFAPWQGRMRQSRDLADYERVTTALRRIDKFRRDALAAEGYPQDFADHVWRIVRAGKCDRLYFDLAPRHEKATRRWTPNIDQLSSISTNDKAAVIALVQVAERDLLASLRTTAA